MAAKRFARLLLLQIFLCFSFGYAQFHEKNIALQRIFISKKIEEAVWGLPQALDNWYEDFGPSEHGNTTHMSACLNSTLALRNNTKKLIQYLDAAGKPPSGVSLGNIAWIGSFDSCQSIPDSHYCLSDFNVTVTEYNKSQSLLVTWGICYPKSCGVVDIYNITEYLLSNVPSNLSFTIQYKHSVCPTKPKYTADVIVTLLFCGLLLLLCLLGTVIDIIKGDSDNAAGLVNNEKDNTIQTTSSAQISVTDDAPSMPSYQNFIDYNSTDMCVPLTSGTVGRTTPQVRHIKGFCEFLLCFSLIRNTMKILDTKVPPIAITSVNGIRVISMFWVILGHTFLLLFYSPLAENRVDMINDTTKLSMTVIINAYFAVDSFFFLSGLLVAYTGFRKLEKNDGRFNWILFYVHRYFRLTPCYMFVILFYVKVTPFLVYSPFWPQIIYISHEPCRKYWWSNLIYINNLYPENFTDQCLEWSWYLANDMQFFIITPLLLILAHRYGWLGLFSSAGSLLLASTTVIAALIGAYDLDPIILGKFHGTDIFTSPAAKEFSNKVYEKPYCRIQPYLVGFFLGYFMHRSYSGTRKPGWIVALAVWAVAAAVAMTLVYAPHDDTLPDGRTWTKAENIVYGTLSRMLWGMALAWVIYACHYGYGGLIQRFLSAKFWIPLSRLTYSAYLVHPIVLSFMFNGSKSTIFYSLTTISYYFIVAVVLSYGAAFILCAVIEFPCDNLESLAVKSLQERR